MPFLLAAFAFLVVPLLFVLLLPLSLIQRYRVGTARQPARRWLTNLNLVSFLISAAIYLFTAAMASLWVADALRFTLAGMATGGVLGFLGLAATRWEAEHERLHFTPSRWLVLGILLVVTGRILYGFWRAWGAWGGAGSAASWLAEAGLAGSMGAGALVLGYGLTYWAGVRGRSKRHSRRRTVRRVPR